MKEAGTISGARPGGLVGRSHRAGRLKGEVNQQRARLAGAYVTHIS
jgi:hypothetical protein